MATNCCGASLECSVCGRKETDVAAMQHDMRLAMLAQAIRELIAAVDILSKRLDREPGKAA